MHTQPPQAETALSITARWLWAFSATLAVALLISATVGLPLLASVATGAATTPGRVHERSAELSRQIAALEARRLMLVHPLSGSLYGTLLAERTQDRAWRVALNAVQQLAATFPADDGGAAVQITQIQLENDSGSLVLNGTVRGVGTRSMTVLAQFSEALQTLPNIETVQSPRFQRELDPNGPYSPFMIHLLLQRESATL